MDTNINSETIAGDVLPVLPARGSQEGRCFRLACARRISPGLYTPESGDRMAEEQDDGIAYWRGTIDARILLVDRALQDMQTQIRQVTDRLTEIQELLRHDMQMNALESRAGNRWTYMVVGGGVLLAALLPFLLPLLGHGKRP